MSSVLLLILGALRISSLQHHNSTKDDVYYELPRFWTHIGFCPAGISQQDIRETLLSDAIQMNLRHIAALPAGAVTNIRIHWLLELIEFTQFTQSGIPIYNFDDLDTFLMDLNDLRLYPVIEFMGNPGGIFFKNPHRNSFYWENLSFQITKHYLNIFGAKKLKFWRFETWNEPDLVNYNKLNFTSEDFWIYANSVHDGLQAAGHRTNSSLHFALRGPAGLFKSETKHPLCWKSLEQCNANIQSCPFEVLTYHRKGKGESGDIMEESKSLLKSIYERFPALTKLSISNDEADPMSGWSTPREFQADIRYAVALVSIVIDHWSAKLRIKEFKNLESISHDNAFLSYHPFEFSQRTLLAHFRMNNSIPVHSQLIQKPVYAALGILSKLGSYAADVELVSAPNSQHIKLLKTIMGPNMPLSVSWILVPHENASHFDNFTLQRNFSFQLCEDETYYYIIETLEDKLTDPVYVWRSFNSPVYPTATEREMMRRKQAPHIHRMGLVTEPSIEIAIGELQFPWIVFLRICSNLVESPKQPTQLSITEITMGEVFVTWEEIVNTTQCLKSYEVWHRSNETLDWSLISESWHLPFPSFQFAPHDGVVDGFYKVRAVDIMGSTSKFSKVLEYIEI